MTFDDEVRRINEKKFKEMLKAQSQPSNSGAAPHGTPIELTDANFRDVVSKHPVVVVDFWAAWCGPCKMVSPIVEELASDMAGKATFGKLNVDENPKVSSEFGIQSIPTIMVFKDGEPVDGLVGAAPKQMIEARIKPHIGEGNGVSPYR